MADCDCHPGKRPSASMADLEQRLRRRSHKITGPRLAILEVMRLHRHPLTNKEIREALPEGGCDLATIYRSMHMLEKMGMVQRFDFGDGTARYELVDAHRGQHHHHLVCTECSRVVEVDECFQQEWQEAIAARHGFKAVSHKLEFFGVCPECQQG